MIHNNFDSIVDIHRTDSDVFENTFLDHRTHPIDYNSNEYEHINQLNSMN